MTIANIMFLFFSILFTLSNEWNKLKTRVENIIEVHQGKKVKSKLNSIKNMTDDEEKNTIIRMLKDYISTVDLNLSKADLINKFYDELLDLCKYDKDTCNIFGFVNTWWVFGEVVKELQYSIFMAEVENIGYKRMKRSIKLMPNELYRTDEKGNVLVDDGIQTTVLDYIRNIKWD